MSDPNATNSDGKPPSVRAPVIVLSADVFIVGVLLAGAALGWFPDVVLWIALAVVVAGLVGLAVFLVCFGWFLLRFRRLRKAFLAAWRKSTSAFRATADVVSDIGP